MVSNLESTEILHHQEPNIILPYQESHLDKKKIVLLLPSTLVRQEVKIFRFKGHYEG